MASVVSGFQVSPREARAGFLHAHKSPGPCSAAGLPSNGVTSAEPITVQAWRTMQATHLPYWHLFCTAERMNAYGQEASPDLHQRVYHSDWKMASSTERSRKY